MGKAINKLLEIGSKAVAANEPSLGFPLRQLSEVLSRELLAMLSVKNGFYSFESALHVFPDRSKEAEIGLDEWNSAELWIKWYQGLAEGCLFFAEDIFGNQFCIKENQIFTFDAETGQLSHLADNLEGWAHAVLDDYGVLTGYTIAREWQESYGKIPVGKRLAPKRFFVVGG